MNCSATAVYHRINKPQWSHAVILVVIQLDSMAFALPTRLTESQRLNATIDDLPLHNAIHQVSMGQLVRDASPGVGSLHAGVMGCSHVFALVAKQTINLPIASFRVDRQSRMANLQHLLAKFGLRADGRFGRTTGHDVYRFCVCIFRDDYDIDGVMIPGQLPTLKTDRMAATYDGQQTIVRRFDSNVAK